MLNDWKAEADDNPITEINITPLTDVMLVLLIIFMVTATFFIAEPVMKVSLPPAVTSIRDSEAADEITVTVNQLGNFFVDGRLVQPADLVEVLMNTARKLPNARKIVVIRADKKAAYGSIIWVMDAARLVGLRNVSLTTEEVDGKDASKRLNIYEPTKLKER